MRKRIKRRQYTRVKETDILEDIEIESVTSRQCIFYYQPLRKKSFPSQHEIPKEGCVRFWEILIYFKCFMNKEAASESCI